MTAGAFLWTVMPVAPVFAGELDTKLDKMVKRMVKTAHDKSPELDTATMAVFPFSADEKLSKKKVDFAVTELVTQQLFQNSKFKLVERTQIERLMAEQKLGLSGALDSETTAKVGKLLGARLAMIGGVAKTGNSYQISARIVDIESAEILSIDLEEISVSVFDEEASRYLTLVPETQAIGIYLCSTSGSLETTLASPKRFDTVTLTPLNPTQGGYSIIGLGVKYYFYGNTWLADVSFAPLGVQFANDLPAYYLAYNSGTGIGNGGTTSLKGALFKVTALRKLKIIGGFSGFLGGGVAMASFEPKKDTENTSIIEEPNPGNSTDKVLSLETVSMKETGYTTPMIRAGVEYRPQTRFGIGIFADYYIQKSDNAILRSVSEPVAGGFRYTTVEFFKFSLPQTYFELTASLYF